jgi:FixJ family two-component response regulator
VNGVEKTVFIVEDVLEVRAALTRMLHIAGYRVRSFQSAEDFLDEQDEAEPGCLLLDVFLPGLSGIELQRELGRSPLPRPIIFLTGNGDIKTGVGAMKEGAVDFLTKPIDNVRLFAAVEQALQRDQERRVQAEIRRVIHHRLETLTPRERQVMAQVVRGRLNKQIAADLGTGEKTVKVHRARVMSKMAAHSIAELVQLGARVGMEIEPALGNGGTALSWRQPECLISERFERARDGVSLRKG